MFVRQKKITTHRGSKIKGDRETRVKTLYLLDGQIPDAKTEHPHTQKVYKEMFFKQQEMEIEKGRPVTIFEQMGLIDPDKIQ